MHHGHERCRLPARMLVLVALAASRCRRGATQARHARATTSWPCARCSAPSRTARSVTWYWNGYRLQPRAGRAGPPALRGGGHEHPPVRSARRREGRQLQDGHPRDPALRGSEDRRGAAHLGQSLDRQAGEGRARQQRSRSTSASAPRTAPASPSQLPLVVNGEPVVATPPRCRCSTRIRSAATTRITSAASTTRPRCSISSVTWTSWPIRAASSASARVGWVRMSDWLPWMEMGDRAGLIYFNTAGRKLDRFEDMSETMKAEIKANYPAYVGAAAARRRAAERDELDLLQESHDAGRQMSEPAPAATRRAAMPVRNPRTGQVDYAIHPLDAPALAELAARLRRQPAGLGRGGHCASCGACCGNGPRRCWPIRPRWSTPCPRIPGATCWRSARFAPLRGLVEGYAALGVTLLARRGRAAVRGAGHRHRDAVRAVSPRRRHQPLEFSRSCCPRWMRSRR